MALSPVCYNLHDCLCVSVFLTSCVSCVFQRGTGRPGSSRVYIQHSPPYIPPPLPTNPRRPQQTHSQTVTLKRPQNRALPFPAIIKPYSAPPAPPKPLPTTPLPTCETLLSQNQPSNKAIRRDIISERPPLPFPLPPATLPKPTFPLQPSKLAPTPFTFSAFHPPTPFSATSSRVEPVPFHFWPGKKLADVPVEETHPQSNRFLTTCFLTLARPRQRQERQRGGRAAEALCLEVS